MTKKLDFATSIIHARECGTLNDILPSGSEIPIQFSNGEKSVLVVGRDKNHTFLIMKNTYKRHYYMNTGWSNYGGWPACSMRKYVQRFYEMLPESIRKIIIPMHIIQYVYNEVVECEDMAFILSSVNVFGDSAFPFKLSQADDLDGTQIDVFCSQKNRVKCLDNEASEWWLRSPYYIESFCTVYKDGSPHAVKAGRECGIVVAFCIENR